MGWSSWVSINLSPPLRWREGGEGWVGLPAPQEPTVCLESSQQPNPDGPTDTTVTIHRAHIIKGLPQPDFMRSDPLEGKKPA